MKKWIIRSSYLLLFIAISGGIFYIHLLTPIITGYAAKNLASGIFVGNRTQESLEKTDLNFSFIKFTKNTVDYNKKEVVSRFLWASSKAIYIEGYGCTLVRGNDVSVIRNRHYPIVPLSNINPDSLAWPAGDKLADTIPASFNQLKLKKALDKAFNDSIGTKGTFAVAIAYKNQLITEKYRTGFSNRNRFLSWSMAKSFTNALVGIMVQQNNLHINKPIELAEWKNDNRSKITIKNLMQMNSGLKWNENYGNLSDVTIMLHTSSDMAEFTYKMPLIAKPDSLWNYSSGSSNSIMGILKKHFNNEVAYLSFPRNALFNPIGMRSAIFETDASGTFLGSSYIYATMRDYVRFGLLYLNDGKWLGKRILPETWVKFTTETAKGSDGKYGALFWLNQSGDYPDVPKDLFMSRGHDGQFIYIIPSLELVVVRTGFSKKGDFDFPKFLASIVDCIQK